MKGRDPMKDDASLLRSVSSVSSFGGDMGVQTHRFWTSAFCFLPFPFILRQTAHPRHWFVSRDFDLGHRPTQVIAAHLLL